MSETANGTVLKITRGLIYMMLGMIAFAGIAMTVAVIALPFGWSHALAEIAKEKPGIDATGLLTWVLVLLAFAIMALGAVWTILRKLLAMIGTVASGDPFVHANAARLKVIGWIMVGLHLIGIPMAFVATHIGERVGEADMHGDFSVTGVLSTLLVFVLAGVFERGAAMREELEGTV